MRQAFQTRISASRAKMGSFCFRQASVAPKFCLSAKARNKDHAGASHGAERPPRKYNRIAGARVLPRLAQKHAAEFLRAVQIIETQCGRDSRTVSKQLHLLSPLVIQAA